MKKYTVLAAAIAMVAFAGCNKEEKNTLPVENGMVTFTVTGEKYSSADKQNYNTADQFIEFSQNEACWTNGYYAPLTLLDQATLEELADALATSRIARLSVPEDYATLPFTVLYPADVFVEGAAEDFPQWNCPMLSEVEWIREVNNGNSVLATGVHSSWPMAAVVNQGGYGSFQLRNCVAVVSPSIKFGTAFLQAFARNNNLTYDETATVEVTSVVLTANVPLSGDAHIDFTGAYPTLVMDETENANNNTLTIYPSTEVMEPVVFGVDAGIERIMGNAAVAPMHAGNTLKMDVYFTLHTAEGDISCRYNGNTVTLTENAEQISILRSCRTTLCMNLFSATGASKVTILN